MFPRPHLRGEPPHHPVDATPSRGRHKHGEWSCGSTGPIFAPEQELSSPLLSPSPGSPWKFPLQAQICRVLTNLQLPRGHLEDQLKHAAHGQPGGPRRVHLVPYRVTVHLPRQGSCLRWHRGCHPCPHSYRGCTVGGLPSLCAPPLRLSTLMAPHTHVFENRPQITK